MKRFILLILAVLVLLGCGAKSDAQNDLYNNQAYYQDENLIEYGQDDKNNMSNASYVQQICNQDENLTITTCEQNNGLNVRDITSTLMDILHVLQPFISICIYLLI